MRIAPQLQGLSEPEIVGLIRRGEAYVDGDTVVPTVVGGTALPALNNAESQASGTTVTTGNSGGTDADAFDAVVIGANMTATFDNAQPAHGSNAFKLALTSTATATTHLDWTGLGGVTELWGAIYVYCNRVPPTSSIRMVSFRNAGAQVSGIKWTSGGGVIAIMNAAGTDVGTASSGLSANTLYRLEFHWLFNTAVGETARVDVYLGDGTSIQTSATLTATSVGAACDEAWFGFTTANFSSTSGDALWIDSLNVNAVGFPGPGPYTEGAAERPPIAVPTVYPPVKFGPF